MVLTPVLEVDQDADEGDTDVDASGARAKWAPGRRAASSTSRSGSVQGMFLITVQAHTLFTHTAPGPDINDPPTGIDWTYKREGGQLLLVHIPGG